jgi:magnesium transporter
VRTASATTTTAASAVPLSTPAKVARWSKAGLQMSSPATLAEIAAPGRGETVWIDLVSPDAAVMDGLASLLGIHPLVVEDIVESNQRAKIEVSDDLVEIVLFAVCGPDDEVAELDIVLGKGFLLTVHGPAVDLWSGQHVRLSLAGVMERGSDHLLWAIVDVVVDGYFPFLDRIGDEIDALQDAVVAKPAADTLEHIFALKRKLMTVRRAVVPVREVFNQLTNRELALIDAGEILWFRDVYDHLIRISDEIDNNREMVSGILDAHLSTVNNELSVVVKRLTGITVVVSGVGAIGGLFGMSEAPAAMTGAEGIGFWMVVSFAVAAAVVAIAVLKKIRWI